MGVEEAYFPEGRFEPDAMADRFRQFFEASRADGASGCRATGEQVWALRDVPGADDFVEFESSLNRIVRSVPMSLFCQYDTELFDGATLFDVFAIHPRMVVRGQVVHNPCYVEAEESKAGARNATGLSPEDVVARLSLIQLVVGGLPDERRIAEFTARALLQVPGVDEVHFAFPSSIVPPDERFEAVRQRCARWATSPNSFDVAAVEAETGTTAFVVRTTSRLVGVILIDAGDPEAFAPYCYVIANLAGAIAMTCEVRRAQAELHAWPERVAALERHLGRIAREFEGLGLLSNAPAFVDPTALPGAAELSPREWEVLTRLLRGDRVRRIATELFVSQSTVRNNLANIFKKMGVHSQEELLDRFRSAEDN